MTVDVKALAMRKVYGIPIVVIVVVAIAVVLYARFGMSSTPVEDVQSEDMPVEDDASGDVDTGGNSVPVFVANPLPVNSTPYVEPTNDTWERRAIEWLISQGHSVQDSETAIRTYLNGDSIPANLVTLRDDAVKQFGLPPEPVTTSPTLPYKGPASAQGTPPTTHTVKNRSDDSWQELARLYYGDVSTPVVIGLRAANNRLPDKLVAGMVVKIPKRRAPKFYKSTSVRNTAAEIARANATTATMVRNLNPGMDFPVKAGTRVRVG